MMKGLRLTVEFAGISIQADGMLVVRDRVAMTTGLDEDLTKNIESTRLIITVSGVPINIMGILTVSSRGFIGSDLSVYSSNT
jgi:hypothetical protein